MLMEVAPVHVSYYIQGINDDYVSDSEPEQQLDGQVPEEDSSSVNTEIEQPNDQSNDNISVATEEVIEADTVSCGTPEEEEIFTSSQLQGESTYSPDTLQESSGRHPSTGYIHYSTRGSDQQQGDTDYELDLPIDEGDTSIESIEPVAGSEPSLVPTVAVHSSPVIQHHPLHFDFELPDMFIQPSADQCPLSPTHSDSSYVTFSR